MPDTTKTLTDLKTEAFAILTSLDPAATPDAEDLATIDQYVDPLLAQLAADEIVYINNSDEIPVEYFLPLTRLLANVAGPRFGSAMNEQAKLADERALKRLVSGKPTFETQKVDYY